MMFPMIAVIIAGGSGTRLWPLSTPDYPKHLLQLTNEKSLLQNTLTRVRRLTDDSKIWIGTEATHDHHVREQLADFDDSHILIEPARRGTANCILFALHALKEAGVDQNEPIAVLWADHLIRDEKGFITSFKRAGELAKKYQRVVYIGTEPWYASTGFGYMEHGPVFDHEALTYDLVSFHEKPDQKTAKKYLASGRYFWNMGYMVATLTTIERDAAEQAPAFWANYQKLKDAKDLDRTYRELQPDNLEYAFSEKLKNALVIPGSFDWTDIGSFGDLHGISTQDEVGNHVRGKAVELEGVSNSYVQNDTDTPVAVIGVDNIVVVNTPNGVLVTNKNFAQRVGDVSKKLL